jgi:trehalose utilization protein
MELPGTRRDFLKASSAVAAAGSLLSPVLRTSASTVSGAGERDETINVVVWDERQPAQKQAYENFLGNQIAGHLKSQPGLSVQSVSIDDPEQGLSESVLKNCDVLIWWGHVRHAEITPETGQKIVARIKSGATSLIALHSAHWSTPFVEAMNERTRLDAERTYNVAGQPAPEIKYARPAQRYTFPGLGVRLTPYGVQQKFPDRSSKVEVHLPYCCFPAVRNDGKPSFVRVLKPDHPIAKGVPATFEIPQTEMYAEPFHVPDPDEVVLEECWATGEWFRSGSVWKLDKGRVFYFRPGHETYPIFKQEIPLKVVTNAVNWLGSRPQ